MVHWRFCLCCVGLLAAVALACAAPIPSVLPKGIAESGPLETPTDDAGVSAIHGFTFQGHGQVGAQNDAMQSRQIVAGTVLVVSGDEDTPALDLRGAFWTGRDFGLRGVGPSVGVRVCHRGKFNGSKGLLERASFRDFARAAIEVGDAREPGRPGNDNLTGAILHAVRCGALVRVVSAQAMDTVVDVAHVRDSASVVWLEGGGDVVVRELNVDCKTPLVVIEGDRKRFGPNNGAVVFDGVKFDDTPGEVVLVDERTDVWLWGSMDRLWFPARAVPVRATLKGRDSRLVIRDPLNWPADCKIDLQDGAECVIENADLRSLPHEWDADRGGRFVLRDCTYKGGLFSGVWQ